MKTKSIKTTTLMLGVLISSLLPGKAQEVVIDFEGLVPGGEFGTPANRSGDYLNGFELRGSGFVFVWSSADPMTPNPSATSDYCSCADTTDGVYFAPAGGGTFSVSSIDVGAFIPIDGRTSFDIIGNRGSDEPLIHSVVDAIDFETVQLDWTDLTSLEIGPTSIGLALIDNIRMETSGLPESVIFSQIPPFVNAWWSDPSSVEFQATPQFRADQFAVDGAATITGIRWWGAYDPSDTPEAPDAFTVRFYSTGMDGLPGELVAEEVLGAGPTRTETANVVTFSDGSSVRVFEYNADISPVRVPAGTHYLSIVNDMTPDVDDAWSWIHGRNGTGGFSAQSAEVPLGTWAVRLSDANFELMGSISVVELSPTLYVYEPFDYTPTTEANENGFFGDGNQGGGRGLGPWSQVDNNGNSTPASPPVNEGDVADEGLMFTDGFGNQLPVAGNAYERRQRVGQVACSSPIDASATAGLTADNSTMWMAFLFQDLGFSGPDFGIGLHSEKMVGNDNQDLEAPGSGVGFSIVSTGGENRNIGTAVYNNAVTARLVPEPTPTFNGPGGSDVFFLAMKVNWNPSGTPDEIFVFIIDDIGTEPEESEAVAMDTFDFDLATQQALDVLNFSETQVGYVDEIRVGSTFGDVTGVVSAGPFDITAIEYSSSGDMLTLTWDSTVGTSYTVKWSRNMIDWEAELEDGILGDAGDSTTRTFDLTGAGLTGAEPVYFRVERE